MTPEERAIKNALGVIICPACEADVCADCFNPEECGCVCHPDHLDDPEDDEPQPLLERDAWHRADAP